MLKIDKTAAVRFGVLLAALVLLGTGVANREYQSVQQKAVKICLECIGIG